MQCYVKPETVLKSDLPLSLSPSIIDTKMYFSSISSSDKTNILAAGSWLQTRTLQFLAVALTSGLFTVAGASAFLHIFLIGASKCCQQQHALIKSLECTSAALKELCTVTASADCSKHSTLHHLPLILIFRVIEGAWCEIPISHSSNSLLIVLIIIMVPSVKVFAV